ncbi:hypothetical protein SLS62_000258 [Diatrype stigma]|uniref:N-acetyltransferase domain-containing protein n=1 Tax=Diatrype stigma TaxID=117547 RepID=A0AAN9YXX8_9PEZI
MATAPPQSQPPRHHPANPGDGDENGLGTRDNGDLGNTPTPISPHLQTVQLPPGFALVPCSPDDVPRLVDVYIRAFAGGDHVYWWGPEAAMRAWNTVRFARFFEDPDEALFKIVDNSNSNNDNEKSDSGDGRIVAFSRWVLPSTMKGEGFRRKVGAAPQPGAQHGQDWEVVGAVEGTAIGGKEQIEKSGNVEDGGIEAKKGNPSPTNPPPPQQEDEEYPEVSEGAEGVDLELYREFFGVVARAQKRWGAGADKLELSLLATDPAYRGRGLGAALVRHGLVAADAEGGGHGGKALLGKGQGKGVDAYLDALPLAAPLYRRYGFEVVERLEFPRARKRLVNGGDAAREPFLFVMVRRPGGRGESGEGLVG